MLKGAYNSGMSLIFQVCHNYEQVYWNLDSEQLLI
jgi:hypothetical protein